MIDMLLRINGYEVSRRKLPKLVFDTRDIEDIETFSAGVKNTGGIGCENHSGITGAYKAGYSGSPER